MVEEKQILPSDTVTSKEVFISQHHQHQLVAYHKYYTNDLHYLNIQCLSTLELNKIISPYACLGTYPRIGMLALIY